MKASCLKIFDFIIFGGGIAGISIAYELSESSRVLVLEQEEAFGYHTTGRSAAIYSELLLDPTLLLLAKESKKFLQKPPEFFSQSPLINTCGCILTGTSRDQDAVELAWKEVCNFGVDAFMVNADEIARHVPIIRNEADAVSCGLFEPNASRIDVDCLIQGYIRGIRSKGSELAVKTRAQNLVRSEGLWVITSDGETFKAPTIINAAGAWADDVAKLAGVTPIGLAPKRRTMITFDAPEHQDISAWPAVGDIGGSYYYMPEAGQLMGSAVNEITSPPCDAQPEEIEIATAVYNIEQHTTLDIQRVNHSWAGLRTFSLDRLPVVGHDPTQEGFFWFAGQGGYGIETGPALARLGARIALDDQADKWAATIGVDSKLLAPARFK